MIRSLVAFALALTLTADQAAHAVDITAPFKARLDFVVGQCALRGDQRGQHVDARARGARTEVSQAQFRRSHGRIRRTARARGNRNGIQLCAESVADRAMKS